MRRQQPPGQFSGRFIIVIVLLAVAYAIAMWFARANIPKHGELVVRGARVMSLLRVPRPDLGSREFRQSHGSELRDKGTVDHLAEHLRGARLALRPLMLLEREEKHVADRQLFLSGRARRCRILAAGDGQELVWPRSAPDPE
jgi:hypothetical protein